MVLVYGAVLKFLQNSFYALYRSFTECVFIEEEGSIVFYKNKYGMASRELASDTVNAIKEAGWDQKKQDDLSESAAAS